MNVLNLSSQSSTTAVHVNDADRKTQAATIPSEQKGKSLFPLFIQALEKVLGPYKSEADHHFDSPLWSLIASYDAVASFMFFDKEMWNTYFGDIGEAPPLPKDIYSILAEPCPFNPGKTVAETHMLVLVPEKLNGTPMTLKRLGELMKGLGKPNYREDSYFGVHENTPFEASHWVLMTKDVIDKSRNISYDEQLKLVEKNPNYRVLTLSEAVAAIFMEYVVTGIHLFNREPVTYTRCQEKGAYGRMVVGGFAPPGLFVLLSDYDGVCIGVAVARKF